MRRLRGVVIGAGYFSQYHHEAWSRIPEVEITAVCDSDAARNQATQARFDVPRAYVDLQAAIAGEQPDFVDIVTPPATHLEIVKMAAPAVPAIICQKPLAPSLQEAREIVAICGQAACRLMVHENFRFQPWHREIKRLLDAHAIGERLHTLAFRSRPGDGWAPDAYLARQPYFRQMPRFLVHETGIHFIDTFRYLGGEIGRVYAILKRLNPVIAGEDCGLLIFEFREGALGLWDANRFNESNTADPRYTFGEFLVECDGGSLRLALDGSLSIQPLGQPGRPHVYGHSRQGFAGDCVHVLQRHFVTCLQSGEPFETEGVDYLANLVVEEACYESAERGLPIDIPEFTKSNL